MVKPPPPSFTALRFMVNPSPALIHSPTVHGTGIIENDEMTDVKWTMNPNPERKFCSDSRRVVLTITPVRGNARYH